VGFHLGRFCAVLIAAALASSAGIASAKSTESQEDSAYSKFESLASRLKAEGDRALAVAGDVTARAVDAGKDAIAETQDDLSPRLETFRQMLNEQKAKLAMVGEDAAVHFDAWKQAATKSWSEMWSDAWTASWSQSWAEIQRAATETLDRFRDWIAKTPDSEEHTETPV
jgi:hypothetical protein